MAENVSTSKFLNDAFVAPEVFALRPDYRALLMVVEGLPGGPSDETSEKLLQDAEAHARAQLAQHAVTDLPHVSAWRTTYKAFGSKPAKYRSSIEALTRRVEAGLPRVNRLTDIYNAISVKYQIPLGGEDLDKYQGPPHCIRATGKEPFQTTAGGETVVEHPDVGEVVWCDDAGVTCRRWNWRQGPRTALSEATNRALFILDALDAVTNEELETAAEELSSILKQLNPDVRVEKRLITGSP
ncbi:Phenylalanyl-tRNA synthetase [Paramyrothecium foliicola]|nr:Phenylalanyl-tRNA synthetase [Paramyrothecium foliicola]